MTDLTVLNSKTGQLVTVRGASALKGKLRLTDGVDLTKPIASQALQQGDASRAKISAKR